METWQTAAAYEAIAQEYYNPDHHPTCANFRAASARVLGPWFRRFCTSNARILEVGAGKSLLLEYLNEKCLTVDHRLLTDSSPRMLGYSRDSSARADCLVVARADRLPVPDHDLTLIVASLGDPYNTSLFWREACRVLQPGGRVLFTTPSHEWATAFRSDTDPNVAEFDLADGQKVHVPSLIPDVDEQIDLIRSAGLRTLAIAEVMLEEIDQGKMSRKLTLPELQGAPIVRGYQARAPELHPAF